MSAISGAESQPIRTAWALADPRLTEYYDTEWGMPRRDEIGVFEQLILELFQTGLSWLTILRKREAFRAAFHGFDPERIARYTPSDIDRLLSDETIVRNRRKIEAAITAAQATVKLRSEGTDIAELVWSYTPTVSPAPKTDDEVPKFTDESIRLAKDLKQRGFQFVGPTNMFALMASIGVVDAHILASHRRGCSGLWNLDGTRRTVAADAEVEAGADAFADSGR